LPIALGILAASGQLPAAALAHRACAGELSLTGAVRPMRGAFAMACGTARAHRERAAHFDEAAAFSREPIGESAILRIPDTEPGEAARPGMPELYLPAQNAAEAALVPDVAVYGAADLRSLCAHLAGGNP
ncbi:magnesium chelatase domain-containing protein, partial [Paraburkholderia sp. BR14262]|uniref:magnesium chelatase domain-containing protein n=1 Tax=Paraburkholderia sp. BR14262 TaxID=3236999 RepID=UPI0034CE42F7